MQHDVKPGDIRIVSNTYSAENSGTSGSGVGETLQSARTAQRLSLEQVALSLKIKPTYLAALEAEQYDLLPTVTHAKGFLRSYAQFLGLGAHVDTLLALYQRAISRTDDKPSLAQPTPLPEGKLPTARVIIGALAGMAALYFLWTGVQESPPSAVIAPPSITSSAPQPIIQQGKPQPVAAPEKPAEPVKPPAAPVAETPAPATTPAEPTPASVPATSGVVVRAISDSWVEVQDRTGATLFSRLLRTGEEYQVVPEPGLRLTTGNGGGVVIVRDGKAGAPLGARAEVVRNVSLSDEPVKAKPAAPKAKKQAKPAITWNPPAADEDAAPTEETD